MAKLTFISRDVHRLVREIEGGASREQILQLALAIKAKVVSAAKGEQNWKAKQSKKGKKKKGIKSTIKKARPIGAAVLPARGQTLKTGSHRNNH